MVTLEELLAGIKALDFTKIASDPKQIAVVAATVLLLILLFVWSSRRRIKQAGECRASSPAKGQDCSRLASATAEPQHQQAASGPSSIGSSSSSHARASSGAQQVSVRQQAVEIPQDSVLRRHYLANEVAKENALHNPYPTDSMLKRHYDAAHKIALDVSPKSSQVDVTGVAGKTEKAEPYWVDIMPVAGRVAVPEDSVLRRHFIAQLRADIEAGFSPRPTDSVLRRHHDSLVGVELEKRLAG